MNPDTRLTVAQLQKICSTHSVPYRSHERIITGFSHEVHRLNDDLVIKLFNSNDANKFKTESGLLASDMPFLKPKLVAKAEKGEVIDRAYVIMTYVPGMALGSNWHRATNAQRERLIKEICRSLKSISHIDPSNISLEAKESWELSVRKRIEDLVAKLQSKNILDSQSVEKVLKTLEKNIHVLARSKMYPVYWDVHFDNFIVNEKFELQAIIDLENVELTPLDYPLVIVKKQMEEPEKYFREEDEKYANKKDYVQLMAWYKKYYPEMFAFENLDDRIKLYELSDTLHLLVNWSHVKSLHEKLERLTS
ncbi:MAG TPA: aminoglycoside phosphotransferase family protein [Candidatus Saccharimonadales bacterium]|nr:aminoglycoside phosphotransferase family protein [Candidatus Saccharimonadales bacterium]